MRENRNAYRVLVGKPGLKTLLQKISHRWGGGYIKLDFEEIRWNEWTGFI
jgi:hypothetical protein